MTEIAFIDVKPRRIDTGAEVTIRLAGGGTDTPYRRGGQDYRAGIVDLPRFRAAFGFDDNGWTGGTVPTSGELAFRPGESSLVTALLAYYWRDAAISIDAGDEAAALSRRLTGSVADVVANDGQMVLSITDPGKTLDKPLLGPGFTGEGGIEGPAEATGRAKRRSWGRVYNVEGELLDKVNNIYEFGDPSKPLGAFDFVRDKGREGPIVPLAWQGSIAATFAALQAAAAPQGGCVAAASIACVKWWTVPAGPLTADIRGENAGGYVENPVGIAARLLSAVGGPAIVGQAAAEALRNLPCGIHIASASDTVAQAVDRLLLGVSLYWVLQPDATVRVGEWAWTAPAASFQGIFIGRERQLPPVKSRKVGYRRNHRVHNDSEISAAVILADDITYLDGTPLEDLRPAEGGAQPNRPPTDNSLAPPLELPRGTIWLDGAGHPYRFGERPWSSNGATWTSNGGDWLGGGYQDIQDQAGPLAREIADAVTAQVARIASDNWLTAGEKAGLVLSHKALIENYIALNAKAIAIGVAGAERTAATAAVNALNAYLVGLVPAWDDTTQDTPADGPTVTALWGTAATTVAALQAAIQGLPGAAGTPGLNGEDGNGIEFVWKRAAAAPDAPVGNGIPAGWSDDPPAGTDPLWVSKAKQKLDGTLLPGESWSAPVRQNGEDGAPGDPGSDGLSIAATRPILTVALTAGGSPKAGELPKSTQMIVYDGLTNVTATVAYAVAVSGCTVSNDGGGAFTLTAVSSEAAYFDVTATAPDGRAITMRIPTTQPKDGSAASRASANVASMNATSTYAAIATADIVAAAGATISGSGNATYLAASFAGAGTRSVRQQARVTIENLTDAGSPNAGTAQVGSAATYIGGDGPSDVGSVSAGHSVTNSTGAPKTFRVKFEIRYYDGATTAQTGAGTYTGKIEVQVA